MKCSVCIDAVYPDQIPFTEAMHEVKSLGFDGIEFWNWEDKDLKAIAACSEAFDLPVIAFCTRLLDPELKAMQEDYIKGLKASIEAAKRLNCKQLITQVGYDHTDRSISLAKRRETLIDTMKRVGEIVTKEDMTFLIEPLNASVDHPGYHLTTSADAYDVLTKVDCDQVKMLFDIYHQQITEGNLITNLTRYMDRIGHLHAAGCPGRGELTTGEICYERVFKAIADLGYEGYVGLEYMISHEPYEGLVQARKMI